MIDTCAMSRYIKQIPFSSITANTTYNETMPIGVLLREEYTMASIKKPKTTLKQEGIHVDDAEQPLVPLIDQMTIKSGLIFARIWRTGGRSLVENEGSVKTAGARQDERAVKRSVDRNIVLLVWELRRYHIYAAGISEIKWFNSNVYNVEGHVVLHSGRELPKKVTAFREVKGLASILAR